MSYSLFVVPFTAFGYELTDDYNEKTRVLAWRMYIGLLGSLTIPWVYKLCFLPIFNGDEVLGAKWVSFGASFIILIFGLMPLLCTERKEAIKQEKVPFKNALKDTFKNRAFLVLLGGCTLIQVCLFTAGTLGLYVYIFVVSQGNKESAAELLGWCGSATALFCYASLPMATWLSSRIGKKQALITCLGVVMLSIFCMYPILNPHVPTYDISLFGHSFKIPYLQMIPAVIFGIGIQGAWLMTNSMTADVCDEDELQTGLRQEGIYGAVSGFAMKTALGISSIGGGILLKVAGFKEGVAPDPHTAENLKHLYLLGQAAGILAGIVILLYYPISKERALEIRVILNERKKRA
jgi:GPH family glycoside/pentoside/hexuronide:cation symporter